MRNEFKIHGYCDEKYLPLTAIFKANFRQQLEWVAGLTVTLEGKMVGLWVGVADANHQKPWQEDTRLEVSSTITISTALCGLMLIARDLPDNGSLRAAFSSVNATN